MWIKVSVAALLDYLQGDIYSFPNELETLQRVVDSSAL
jgi:hypothetical protein